MFILWRYEKRVFSLLLDLCILSCLIILLWQVTSQASNQKAAQLIDFEAMKRDIKHLSTQLEYSQLKIQDVNNILKKLEDMQSSLRATMEDTSNELQLVKASLKSLGPKTKGEAIEVTRERRILSEKMALLEKRIGKCRVLLLKTEALKKKFYQKQKKLLTSNLFYREKDIVSLITSVLKEAPSWPKTVTLYITKRSGINVISKHLWAFLGGVLAAIILGAGVSTLFYKLARCLEPKGKSPKWWSKIFYSLATRLSISFLLFFLAVDVWLLTGRTFETSYLVALLTASSFYVFLISMLKSCEIVFSQNKEFVDDHKIRTVKRIIRSGKVFSLFISILVLIELPPLNRDLPEIYIQLIHAILVPLATVLFIGSVSPCLKMIKSRFVRKVLVWFLYLWVFIITGAQLLGFRNLSAHFAMGIICTYISGLFIYWLKGTLHHLLDDFSMGRNDWSRQVRRKLGIKEDEILKAFFWAKTGLSIILWCIWGASLFYFWSISSAYRNRIFSLFFYGFSIGKLRIMPLRLIAATFIFGTSWGISSWLKRHLEKKLQESYMTKSARDALATLVGYLGFIIAIMVGLRIAGIHLTNLAVIVGALSVGIGFGLQNIVNNFVSGLILLLERPIKRGDWIIVGQTEGYVKNISVRSTVIQTFDQSEVIVPNSELISNHVINWTLANVQGRLTLFVGVAYGSDTRLVEKILHEVAKAHPLVLTDHPDMKPKVYFWEFGDNSLNFRLDVFLKDVTKRRIVRSELNFAIDEAFRKHGINIPFPQRDVYIKEFKLTGEKKEET